MHQVSNGDADHDPYKYNDEELRYLYGHVEAHYPVPAIRYGYSAGFYGQVEKSLIDAAMKSSTPQPYYMIDIERNCYVLTNCPCCQF